MDDTRYICPRPRASRACIPCKKHKTRCVASAQSPLCRRCESTGSICIYNDGKQPKSRNPPPQRSKPSCSQSEKGRGQTDCALERLPPATLDLQYEDESDKVVQLHNNVFGCHAHEDPKCCIPARPSNDEEKKPKKPSVNMSQANQMIQLFCMRNACFPFVVLPENTTAEELSRRRPFLLLSILVVTSDVNPMLQKSLDERLRKVVATRIVMQGEKSMDYLQGLLIYLACDTRHPIHLKPTNNQIFQYMQLAIAMVSDLDLERKTESSCGDRLVAVNTLLGCYYQSANTAMAFKRSNNFTFKPSDELLDSILMANNEQITQIAVAATRLTKFVEKVHRIDIDKEIAESSVWPECPLQKLTKAYLQELLQIESAFPESVHENIKIQVLRRFAKIELYTMALGQEKHRPHGQRKRSTNHRSQNTNPQSYFQIFSTCFTEINNFIEFIINTSSADYRRLPFSEWGMVSVAVIYFSKICNAKILDIENLSSYEEVIDTERATWLAGIDRLCARLEEVSTTTQEKNTCSRRIPDFFYLFSTIFKLFKGNFVRESNTTKTSQAEKRSSCRRNSSRSQCPVMNGDLQHTDYWDMLMMDDDTQNLLGDIGECFGPEAGIDINYPAYFDLTSWVDIS